MGREQPTVVLRPNQNRRAERAKRAKETKNRIIPELLRSCPRAKHGIAKTELIVDPEANGNLPASANPTWLSAREQCLPPDLKIRVQPLDTLTAASRISEKISPSTRGNTAVRSRSSNRPNVAVLNMASALRPGGGFLDGANSQEEFLCARTTLYPSLWDSFYRLPDISAIYTPDVLVFRDNLPEANNLPKRDRFFVDVISSSMLRFSDARAEGCSCGVSYCDRHRDIVLRKMKAVLRVAQSRGIEKLVLGAWGCGAHGNPVKEVAKNWRKVIAGAPRQRRPNAERWEGFKEIIFAVPDRSMLREFENAFHDVLVVEQPTSALRTPVHPTGEMDGEEARTSELLSKIAEIEMQVEQTQNLRLRNRLRETLSSLQKELSQGPTTQLTNAEDTSPEDPILDEAMADEGYVLSGFPAASDEEEESGYYHLATRDIDSDSGSSAGLPNSSADLYEFRPSAPDLDSQTSHSRSHSRSPSDNVDLEEDEPENLTLDSTVSHSPHFDPDTGWFAGSLDGLTAVLRSSAGGGQVGDCSHVSPGSPDLVRPTSGGDLGIDALALRDYLTRYQGSDVRDY